MNAHVFVWYDEMRCVCVWVSVEFVAQSGKSIVKQASREG
jgi:hypothetical protein